MKTTTDKKYDAVAEIRKARTKISQELQGKSTSEIIAYFKEKAAAAELSTK